jgi:hypothetical protein
LLVPLQFDTAPSTSWRKSAAVSGLSCRPNSFEKQVRKLFVIVGPLELQTSRLPFNEAQPFVEIVIEIPVDTKE